MAYKIDFEADNFDISETNGVVRIVTSVPLYTGTGSPETVLTAPIGSLYTNLSGGAATTLYVKTTGAGNTGWTAK